MRPWSINLRTLDDATFYCKGAVLTRPRPEGVKSLQPHCQGEEAAQGRPRKRIYGGTQQALWEQLWNLPESAKSALLIGHNPALHDLALELAHADLNELLPSAGGKFPTGAMASFRFDGAWKALEPHGAVLASYITPKAIAVSSHDRREHVLQRCR